MNRASRQLSLTTSMKPTENIMKKLEDILEKLTE